MHLLYMKYITPRKRTEAFVRPL